MAHSIELLPEPDPDAHAEAAEATGLRRWDSDQRVDHLRLGRSGGLTCPA